MPFVGPKRIMVAAVVVAVSASCGGGAPSSPSPPVPPSQSYQTSGRVIDALSGAVEPGISVALQTSERATSDPSGAFTLSSKTFSAAPELVTFTAASVVTRQVYFRVPGADLSVSLIPASFNLAAFDEGFRAPTLQRWVTAPPIVIDARELQFTEANATSYPALAGQMSADEVASLQADLTWALPQMTGGTYTAFNGVTLRTSPAGAPVTVLASGVITVVRLVGLEAAIGAIGLGQWQFRFDGSVSGGLVMLDRDFERSGNPLRRAVRTHELGHALGYNHVTLVESVMNPIAGFEPTAFDLAACRIAFERQPGNASPDTDSSGASLNRVARDAAWSRRVR